MSNCSKTEPENALGETTLVGRLSRLLAAIADELACAANEVVMLGELMSHDAVKLERREAAYDLQAFDLFAQTAHAHARLLKRLAEGDAGHSSDGISALIEEVPFAHIRQRLLTAVSGGNSKPFSEEANGSEVSWF